MQPIAVLHAVIGRVAGPHMHVPFVADDALFQARQAGRADQVSAGRIAVIAALAHRDVQAEHDRFGECQLDLAVIAAWAQDADVGDHPLPRSYHRHGFLGGEEAVLVEPLERRELMALAEQALQIFLGDVAVARGDVDDELRRSLVRAGSVSDGSPLTVAYASGSEIARQCLAYQAFDRAALEGHHRRNSSPLPPAALSSAMSSRTPAFSTSFRCSAVALPSTISVSTSDSSHRNASACLPIFV